MERTMYFLKSVVVSWPLMATGIWAAELSESATPPNAMGQVSQRVFNHFMQMAVERQVTITDSILGTSVRGTVSTRGQVIPLLVPDRQHGVLELRFIGTTHSPRMFGQNGPATIVSSARSDVLVRKQIRLDDRGLHLQPAVASVSTHLNIGSVSANRRFVERIARRRANRSQDAVRAITSQRTGSRIQQEVDRDAAKPLGQVQGYFEQGFREPLRLRDSLPQFFQFSTTAEHLSLMLRQCSRSHHQAPSVVPAMDPEHDIAVALHQSSISSIYEVFFAGQTVQDRDVLHTLHLLTGEDPRPLRVHARTPAWSFQMADQKPLSLTFEDHTAAIELHLKSLQYGSRSYPGSFTVSVRYRVFNEEGAPRMERLGNVEVEGKADSLSPGEVGEALAILRTKFSAVFPSRFAFEGLVPPTGDAWSKLRMLELHELTVDQGWLVVGYRLPAAGRLLVSAGSAAVPATRE